MSLSCHSVKGMTSPQDESERTWEPLTQVYEDVPVIAKEYVDDDTLTEALDQIEDDQLSDPVSVSESSSSGDNTSDE